MEMSWITFYQEPNSFVKFRTSKEPAKDFILLYEDFISFFNKNFTVNNYIDLRKNLDSFEVLMVYRVDDASLCKWEVQTVIEEEHNFNSLWELNKPEEEKISDFKRDTSYYNDIIKSGKDLNRGVFKK